MKQNLNITQPLLKKLIIERNLKYPVPKWVLFCKFFFDKGFDVKVYKAYTTVSKYVYVTRGKKTIKIRFGDHKPSRYKEAIKDSDYYVGVFNNGWITTEQVQELVLKDFEGR